jgi:L-ribulose-5-phosphate 3-epimerase
MNLSFGYNTNGFAHHNLDEALSIIAETGYRGVALTLDTHHCNPFTAEPADLVRLRERLDQLQLRVVIETGARYLLNPQKQHYPTLVSVDGRQIRLEFLRRAVDIAHELHAECVSFWSGTPEPDVSEHQSWDWLVTSCLQLADHAKRRGVQLAFETAPGMLVDNMAKFEVLKKHITSARFGLTLDVGHVFCAETAPFRQVFGKFSGLIRNIHIEDIRNRKSDHLMFGEGELDFVNILRVIADNKYTGLVNIELPQDSHRAPEVARRSLEFLTATCQRLSQPAAPAAPG